MLLHTTSETGQPAVYINGGSIAARSIYSAQIQANAIVADHIDSEQITSDHISAAGITADNIKGKTLSSSVPVTSGGSFINLDTGNINFAGGNLTWDNTTKTFYINASTLQIGGKNVLNTDTDLAKQINNKSTTRIQGNKLHFTNKVLMDDAFIELLTANNIFAQKIDAREIDANRITSGTLEADYIQGGTFDGQSMIVKNITADAIKGGTFDGQSMTIKNLTADAIVAGTLDMSKFTVSNLSADDIKTGTLDISGGLRVTSGRHQIMSIDPETLDLEFNVNKMTIGGVKLISEEDQPQMEENIANELEGKLKQHLHIAYADDASGNGFSFSPLNKSYLGMYSDYNKEPLKAKEKYQWIKIEGNTGKSSKTHIAYANRKNGLLVDFSLTDSDREYLGIYSNFSEEPPSPEVYKWTKIKGEVGNPGQDAITIVLSNEAHTFVAGITNAEAASDIIKVDAYKGTTKTPVKIGTITGTIADKITATIKNNNTTNAQITINVTTALTTSSGNITIPITVDGKSFSKVYSWALSFKGNTGSAGGKGKTGAPGANAKLVTLTATGQIFTKPKVGSITPSKITVTASGQNTTISTSHWQYSINGGAFTRTKPAYVTVINSTTVDIANTMSNKTLAIKVRTADAVEDTLTIARIEDGLDGSDGTDATIAFLSNESHTFAGDINNAIAATDSIEVTAYKGSTKQNVSIGTITGQVTGLKAAIASNTNNTIAPKITITVTTALKETSGTLTIPLTVNGTIYTRYYSWSVARKGATGGPGSPGSPGSDAQILTLTPNNQVFKVPKKGAITPATITITATGQNISVPTANANWQYSVNGGTLTTTLPTGVTRSGAVVTVNGTKFTGNTLTTKVSSGTIQDTVTIYKAIDGVDGSKGDTGDRGPQGVSITKVDVEYYLSTSSTELAGGVWSTTAPAWKNGRFMWSKTVTTYTSGGPTESKPVCITGAKGSTGGTGATGRGISSIVEQFYLSDSKTVEPPTSGWLTSPPTWSPGKYIWTRSLITYTKGTPATSTTKPLVSSEWEAINEIQIGGRNLLRNSDKKVSNGTYNIASYDLTDKIKEGEEVTLTIWGSLAATKSSFRAYNSGGNVHLAILTDNRDGTYSVTFKWRIRGSTNTYLNVYAFTNAQTGTSTINKIKLEKGSVTTDWTPAPEDVAASIKAAQDKANAASNSASTANSLLADIASDSVLTPGEKKNIKKEWDVIVGEKPKIDASANTYGITTQKTAYNNAYNALNTYLTGSGGLLVNLNIKSTIVGTTFRNNFKNYYNARQDLLNKIADSAKSLVDELEIGGRNLIYQTKSFSGWTVFNTSVASASNVSNGIRVTWKSANQSAIQNDLTQTLIRNQEYVIKLKARGTLDRLQLFILSTPTPNLMFYSSPNILNATEFKEIIIPFKYTHPNTSQKIFIGGTSNAVGQWLEIENESVKLEKGNKATDWSPAPEDLALDVNKKTYNPVRYIRDWSNGSTANSGNHWYELMAIDEYGDNKALNRTVTSNGSATSNLNHLTNGVTSTGTYVSVGNSTSPVYVQVDLGKIYDNIAEIKVWKYYNDGRTYRESKTEVSSDGVTWHPIYDYTVEGEYPSTAQGKSIPNTIAKTHSIITGRGTKNVIDKKAEAERIKAKAYADGVVTAEEKKRIADAENKYRKALILSRASSGKLMNSDPNFSKNLEEFSAYNNAGNGNVKILFENASSSSGPSGVTRRLRVTSIGTASPTWGGIVARPAFKSRVNAEYVIRFTALLPKGRSFQYNSNAMGTGYAAEWLTSNEGTGKWEEYAYYYKCGSTGTFSTFGYMYTLGGATPTTARPLVWYLDKYEALDISNVTGNPSQEDVDGKASAEDLTNAKNDISQDINTATKDKLDRSEYEEFLDNYQGYQEQLSKDLSTANDSLDTALSRTATVEQKLGEGAADWIFTQTRIRMSDEGITIGEIGRGSYIQVSNDKISFYNGTGDAVAYVSGGMLFINHAIFVESIQISEFMVSGEISGHLTFRYVGE